MAILEQLATMHCTNHYKRGAADAVWGAAVLRFPEQGGQAQYVSFWGRRRATLQWKAAPPTSVDRARGVFRGSHTIKLNEGYQDVDWRDDYYGLSTAVRSLDARPLEQVAPAARPERRAPRPANPGAARVPRGRTCVECGQERTHRFDCPLRGCTECGRQQRDGHEVDCSRANRQTRSARASASLGRQGRRTPRVRSVERCPSCECRGGDHFSWCQIAHPPPVAEPAPQPPVVTPAPNPACAECGAVGGTHFRWCISGLPPAPEPIPVQEVAPPPQPVAPTKRVDEDAPVLRRPRRVDF